MNSEEIQKLNGFLKTRDVPGFTNQPFIQKIPKPWGYELKFTPDGLSYVGKILHINAGRRISLQVHESKQESWLLLKGKITMILEDTTGELVEINMEMGQGYSTGIGQKHRLVGVEDSDVLEVSMPEAGNTYRLEDDYSRPTETPEMRQDPNRGWINNS